MKYISVAFLVLVAACGGSGGNTITTPPKPRALDPYLTVRVRDLLDPATAAGKTNWHVFALLTGPYTAQNGIGFEGNIAPSDVALGHNFLCVRVIADSVGQRLLSILALGDTANASSNPDAQAASIVTDWYNGNHVLPSGWMALTFTPQDAFASAQFTAGHGLVPSDPIKWGFDWTGAGVTSFYERTDTDAACATM